MWMTATLINNTRIKSNFVETLINGPTKNNSNVRLTF